MARDASGKGNKEVCIIVSIMLAMLGLVGLSAVGVNINILRYIIGFFYLTFIPGYIIIKILKLRKLNLIETILYSTGLSLVFLQLLGLFVNTFYPHIGVLRPLSTTPLMATLTILLLLLCFFAYKGSYAFGNLILPKITKASPNYILFSILLVSLGGVGTILLTRSGNNTILLVLIGLISTLIIATTLFRNWNLETYFPVLIWSVSLSLLIISILISKQVLTGGDLPDELYYLRLTSGMSWWDHGISASTLNTMVGITILPTIYSNILNMSEVWTAKIIYPLFTSLIPLGLYQIYSKQTNKQTAFLAICFFVTQFAFYGRLTCVGSRVMIAELFFVLLVLVILKKEQHVSQRILLIAFSVGLIMSHYSTSYIWLIYIFTLWLLSLLFNKYTSKAGFRQYITGNYVVLFIVMAFCWYIYTTGSITFNTMLGFGENVVESLSDFFSPQQRSPEILAAVGMTELSFLIQEIKRYVYLTAISFIVIGLINSVVRYMRYRKLDFSEDYSLSSLIFMGLLASSVVLPFVSVGYGAWRPYFQSLFFLSPFFVLGGYTVFEFISRPFRFKSESYKSIFVSIFLVIHFLFQVGFIYALVGLPSSYLVDATGPCYDGRIVYKTDDYAAQWLSSYGDKSMIVYRDLSGAAHLLCGYGFKWWEFRFFADDADAPPTGDHPYIKLGDLKLAQENNAYVFLGYTNVVKSKVEVFNESAEPYYPSSFQEALIYNNKIYTNGEAQVFR